MAKVKIQGNASGTGVLTVTAPNTSTDRTVTLPDATGTLTFTPSITDNGNATAITIDSNESVFVGTASTPNSTNEGFAVENRGWDLVTLACNSTNSNHTAINVHRGGNGGRAMMWFYNTTNVGSITVSSSATAYNTSSDYRLKENVVPMTGSIDRLKELKPSRFNFITAADTTVDGFLAHEVSDLVPEAITGTKDAVDDNGDAVMQGIDQSKLVPLLTSALQEAVAKIEELTIRIEQLEVI